jgi:hypothetical protein
MTKKYAMYAGKYYIGDLCYAFGDNWDEVCDKIIDYDLNVLDGRFVLADGTTFCIFSTKYGDGSYFSNIGENFPVDSGSIGVVETKFLPKEFAESIGGNYPLGAIRDFSEDFLCYADEYGTLNFGEVSIFTGDMEEDEDDYYDDGIPYVDKYIDPVY